MHQWFKRICNHEIELNEQNVKKLNYFFKRKNEGYCFHEWDFWEPEPTCVHCSVIDKHPEWILEKTPLCISWPRNYARTQYFDSLFHKINGVEKIPWCDSWLDELCEKVPAICNWYDIYHVFKKEHLEEWWIAWNLISCNEDKITMKPIHYKYLLYIDDHWQNSTRTKKKLNVFYMLYKVVEMCGDSTDWVPMKLRKTTLEKLDKEWKSICEQEHWKFISTPKILKEIHWNKK